MKNQTETVISAENYFAWINVPVNLTDQALILRNTVSLDKHSLHPSRFARLHQLWRYFQRSSRDGVFGLRNILFFPIWCISESQKTRNA